MSLDASRMKELEPNKRYTLATALITAQSARTLDDLASMFIRRMQNIHVKASEALDKYREEYQTRTDRLITTLRDVVVAYSTEGEIKERFNEIEKALGENPDRLLTECEAHLAYAGNNYYPFLWRFYRSHRSILLQILKQVQLRSTTQDKSIEASIQFIIDHTSSRSDWLSVVKTEEKQTIQLLDLEWIPQKWWQLITNQTNKKSYPDFINRRYFEMCVFSQVMWELKSGDLYIENSDAFADYRTQQISWSEYEANIDDFGKLVNLPVEPKAFVAHVKNWLEDIIQKTDQSFPNNQSVRLEQGRPVITKAKKKIDSQKLAQIELLIAERIEPVNLLDILIDTELWLNWTQYFRLLSGHDSKIEDSVSRYLAATFCYGCNLGSSQTANSLSSFDRKQIAYVNQRHICDELFTDVIDWKLIETHLPDMLRVVLSIKAGKFTASTIETKIRDIQP